MHYKTEKYHTFCVLEFLKDAKLISQRLITFSWQCTPIEKGQIIEGKSELLLSGLSGPRPLLTLTGR